MTYQERFAWIWTLSLTVLLGGYLVFVWLDPQAQASLDMATRVAHLAIPLAALGAIALGTFMAGWLRGEVGPRAARDERDRRIAQRATSVGYMVLMAGTILVGCVLPFDRSGWELVYAALFFIGLAELVHHGMIIVSYRRGLRD